MNGTDAFQAVTLVVAAVWLALVVIRFRRSTPFLAGGLLVLGVGGLAAAWLGAVPWAALGFSSPSPWWQTVAFALVWLTLMLAWSPLADRIATRFVAEPPTLEAFRPIQESTAKLVGGILVAWVLGGFLEELVFRGMILTSLEALLTPLPGPLAAGVAVVIAAAGAAIAHLYQGLRASLIIAQLSVLFGVLFIVSGYDLWAVVLCHGLYDTVAFIRFARGTSTYSEPDGA